ncbi:MAG: polyphenol oxidase family protein [Desulfobacteraceae bacterium]|jgi:YfiH family protein
MQPFNKNNQKIDEKTPGDIFYYCFPGLTKYNSLCHRIYTRNHGYSNHPCKSLNISYAVNDDPACVYQNLMLIQQNTGAERLVHMNQQHGKNIISLKYGNKIESDKVFDADALITDIPSVAIMVKQADCQGVILFDPVESAVAVVHSGWKGSTLNILGETVKRMVNDFNCSPENIEAGIGPSLGPCCAEFKTYKDIFPEHFQKHMVGEFNFDFWTISKMQLIDAGLKKESIEKTGICTKCRTDIFFSYRGEGITGRFATVAMIKK